MALELELAFKSGATLNAIERDQLNQFDQVTGMAEDWYPIWALVVRCERQE